MNTKYTTIIKPSKRFLAIDLKELWNYRELFFFLAWRNVTIKYKQTILGISWAGIQPIIITVIFTIIFGKVAKLPDNGIPYPLIVMAGTLPWMFFSNAITQASASIVSSSGMVQKIYFPRVILPTSSIISSLLDFVITFALFVILLIYYGLPLTINILYLPLFILLLVFTTLAIGFWFSALNVAYRDVKILIPFIIRIGLYISPVGFLSSTIPERYQIYYSINPFVGIIDGFRWCLLGNNVTLYWPGLLLSIVLVVILFFSGLFYFIKTEKTFADII